MPDILIRDVPEPVVSAIEARAKELGLSRPEFLRRCLEVEVMRSRVPITVEDWSHFSKAFADLLDDSVMDQAWT
jgi:hypothetical protein